MHAKGQRRTKTSSRQRLQNRHDPRRLENKGGPWSGPDAPPVWVPPPPACSQNRPRTTRAGRAAVVS